MKKLKNKLLMIKEFGIKLKGNFRREAIPLGVKLKDLIVLIVSCQNFPLLQKFSYIGFTQK